MSRQIALALGLACLGEIAAILLLNHGVFTYTLDDPYIHLSLARNLAQGHYGLNLSELSAPSSSPLWPFLLAPLSFTGKYFLYVPVSLNIICAFGCLTIALRIINLCFADWPGLKTGQALGAAIGLIFCLNLPALIFCGMEHALQTMLSLCILYGLIRVSLGRAPDPLFCLAVALSPLLRYENLALSMLAVAYLYIYGNRSQALFCLLGFGLPLTGFTLFLKLNGLGYLPSSITLKSLELSSGFCSRIAANLAKNLGTFEGLTLAVWILVPLKAALSRQRPNPVRLLAALCTLAGLAHLALGSFGLLGRYEAYILDFIFLGSIYLYKEFLAGLTGRPAWQSALTGTFVLLTLCFPGLFTSLASPLASANIHLQQAQMARYARDFHQAPVAVNDIGLVSYASGRYVLDLWGLSEPEAAKLRLARQDSLWISELAAKRGAELIMIYDNVFKPPLPDFVNLGSLEFTVPRLSAAYAKVDFHAASPEAAAVIRPKLEEFTKTLPEGARFVFNDQ